MTKLKTAPPQQVIPDPSPGADGRSFGGRLGLSVPRGWWPSAPALKAYEAGGFCWVQVHAPPSAVLRDDEALAHHARSLRATLDTTGLRLLIHGPGELRAGEPGHELALEGMLAHAALAGAELVVYHGRAGADGARDGLPGADPDAREVGALRRLAQLAEVLGVTIAVENLAPTYPGPARPSHATDGVADLVRRVESERVRMCFDLGHAHIVAERGGTDVRRLLMPALDLVALFHVHDNLGARRRGERHAGLDPLRLDLHLPPGGGTLPWWSVAVPLREHPAPLMLEVHPAHRPEAVTLERVTSEVLRGRGRGA